MSELTYGYETTLPGASHEQAIERVTAALAEEGFGVLTTIDVKATFKKKLDADFRPYTILGACNPKLAHRALGSDPHIGLMLPCNVVVQEQGGVVKVAIVDPKAMFQIMEGDALKEVAGEADERLQRVIGKLSQPSS